MMYCQDCSLSHGPRCPKDMERIRELEKEIEKLRRNERR